MLELLELLRPIDIAVAVMWAASAVLVLTWIGVTAVLLLQHCARRCWRGLRLRAAARAPGAVAKV
jgi:hypothetical protein